jgi:hypothetical protein
MSRRWLLAIPICGVPCSVTAAQDGLPAPDFGNAGWVITTSDDTDPARRAAASTTDLLVDAAGRILLVGWASTGDARTVPAVVRLRADGGVDTGWGVAGLARSDTALARPIGFSLAAGALLADGRVLVAADMQRSGPVPELCTLIQVYTATGAVDASFDPGMPDDCTSFGQPAATPPMSGYFDGPSVAVDAAGITVRGVAGPGTAGSGPLAATRVDFNGAAVPGFGSGGNALIALRTLAGSPAGVVGLCAIGTSVGIGRLTATGALDPTFGTGGCSPIAFGATPMQLVSLAVDRLDRIVVAATPRVQPVTPAPVDCFYCIARHTAGGLADAQFNAAGTAPGGPGFLPLYPGIVQDYATSARDVAGRAHNGVVVAGTVRIAASAVMRPMVLGLGAAGLPDARFGDGSFGTGSAVFDLPAFAGRQNFLVHIARAPSGDLVVAAVGVGTAPLFVAGVTRLVDDGVFGDGMEAGP